jgi:hypothetical protein
MLPGGSSEDLKMQEDQDATAEGTVERRVALRRGAAVLAGVAGLGVAAAAAAPGASAAPGDNLVLGEANVAGDVTTSVTSGSDTTATLSVANTGDGAPLNVALQTQQLPAAASVVGDLASFDLDANGSGFASYTHVTGSEPDGPASGVVYTSWWSFQPVAIAPTRAVDTRLASGRTNIFPLSALDASGRLRGGQTVTLNLNEFANSPGGVFANVTVTGPTGAGFITLFPGGTRPLTSNVTYTTNQTVSNFSFTAADFNPDTGLMSLQIFTTTTTHVIFDITGLSVPDLTLINPAIAGGVAARQVAARTVDPAKRPAWYPKNR